MNGRRLQGGTHIQIPSLHPTLPFRDLRTPSPPNDTEALSTDPTGLPGRRSRTPIHQRLLPSPQPAANPQLESPEKTVKVIQSVITY